MQPLCDTHVHLDWLGPPAERDRHLDEARAAGVGSFVVPGVTPGRWDGLLALAADQPEVWAAPGVHPQHAREWSPPVARRLEALLAGSCVVAVGEIGLDGLVAVPLAQQERAFREQLRLAVAARKPVLIHCRRATARLLAILREEGAGTVGGILHAFSGSEDSARAAFALGFAVGFGGPLTWPQARRAPLLLAALPESAIVLESDAPDLAPHPHRGQANRPAWLPLIAARVAEVRGWTREETARITTANARRVLQLPARGPSPPQG